MDNLENYVSNIIIENRELGNLDDKKIIISMCKKLLRSRHLSLSAAYNIVKKVYNDLSIYFPFDSFGQFRLEYDGPMTVTNSNFYSITSYSNINGTPQIFHQSGPIDNNDFFGDFFSLDINGFYERSIFDIYSNVFSNIFNTNDNADVPVTATEEALKKIPVVEYSKMNDSEKSKYKSCPICMDDFDADLKT